MCSSSPTKSTRVIEIERLKSRRDYLRIAKSGEKWVSPSMVIQAKPRDKKPFLPHKLNKKIFVGFTVTKSVGNSVARNRIKRRLKSAAQKALNEESGLGKEIVIIGRNAALNYPFELIVKDLKWSLKKLNEKFYKDTKEQTIEEH